MALMYEHYLIDNPPKKKAAAHDPEYQEEDVPEGGYYDPDFDAEWDALDEAEPQPTAQPVKLNRDIVPKNPPNTQPEEEVIPSEEGISIKDKTKWEEVE